jgi:NAD(P)-dependent dehydrogenase (short-subunit alcohol dehydrogenase family)
MARLGWPEDIAGAVVSLAGRGGGYTTGAVGRVDGGISVAARPPMFGGEK